MRLLADLHISPRTVEHLRSLRHDIVRVNEILPLTAPDASIVDVAAREDRAVLTQDLDLSAIIALQRKKFPSLISLRLASSRIEYVKWYIDGSTSWGERRSWKNVSVGFINGSRTPDSFRSR